jgi:hypothetical protein
VDQMEKKMEKKGSEVGDWQLLKALGAWGGEGKGGGVGSVPCGGRRRSREGPSAAVSSAERPVVAPTVGHGRWRCGATGEGGGARLTQRERLTGGTGW